MIQLVVRFLLLSNFLWGWYGLNSKELAKSTTSIHIQYANKLTKSIIPVLEKEFDLHCSGEGGSMADNISDISLCFTANRRATIEEARELLVRCTQRVSELFNTDEGVRPYLIEYPFPPSRVEIMLRFWTDYAAYADGTISCVFGTRGKVFYDTKNPFLNQSTNCHKESYEEALKIVTQSNLPDSACRQHAKKPYEDDLDRFFYSFTKEANKKYGILCKRPGGDMRDGIKRFDFLFVKKKRANLEEARNIEMGLTQLLIDKINADEKLRPYLANYPFRIDQTRIRVEFLGKGLYDFTDGSLYSVTRETDNQIVYDKWDPPDGCWLPSHPTPVKKESYEEAQEALRTSIKKR